MDLRTRIRALSWLGVLMAVSLVACGDDGEERGDAGGGSTSAGAGSGDTGGGDSDVVADCQASCDAGKPLMCAQDLSELCKQLCPAYGQQTAECKEAAGPYFACAKDAEYECGLLGAALAEDECVPERLAFQEACEGS